MCLKGPLCFTNGFLCFITFYFVLSFFLASVLWFKKAEVGRGRGGNSPPAMCFTFLVVLVYVIKLSCKG